MSPKEVSEIPGVDVVLGTRNKGDVVYYVNKAKDEGKSQVHVQGVLQNKVFEDLKIEDYQDKTRAFLKIRSKKIIANGVACHNVDWCSIFIANASPAASTASILFMLHNTSSSVGKSVARP